MVIRFQLAGNTITSVTRTKNMQMCWLKEIYIYIWIKVADSCGTYERPKTLRSPMEEIAKRSCHNVS